MLRNLYQSFFPTPRFLMAPSFGLDLSDESLKFVELVSTRHGARLGRYGERKIPPGIIESGRIKDPKKLAEVLAAVKKEEGLNYVRVSLPEEQIYLFSLRLEKEGLKNVREGIELSLEEHIPISAENAIFDYEIVEENEKSLKLEVGAIPKNVIESYLTVFKESGLVARSFELEAQAIARAVIKKGDPGTYLLVDFGRTRTGIFIVSRGIVVFTSTLSFGGAMLTSLIQKNLNITESQADDLKRRVGLQRSLEDEKIYPAILGSCTVLRDEINKHFIYWHTHDDKEGRSHPPIDKIILCGGDANLNGLPEYLSISIKTKVDVANVWTNILDLGEYTPPILFNRSLAYATALGLALGDFEHD